MAEQMTATQNGVAEFDFGYAELKTSEFPLEMLRGADGKNPPVLVLRCIEDNPAYQEELLKIGGSRSRAEVDAKDLVAGKSDAASRAVKRWRDGEEEIEDDLKAYPGTVVVGWRNVPDSNGDEVPWSVDACRQFLRALPKWIFKRVRLHVLLSRNFTNQFPSPVDLAGNS